MKYILLIATLGICINISNAQSKDQVKEYFINVIKSENDPYIVFVRNVLDKFYLDFPISSDEVREDVIVELQNLNKEYLLSRFVLLNSQDFVLGGKILTIIFLDKPDKIFDIAIKSTGDSPSLLFSFSENKKDKKDFLDFYKKSKLAKYSRFAY